jgi:hypothetical protein
VALIIIITIMGIHFIGASGFVGGLFQFKAEFDS